MAVRSSVAARGRTTPARPARATATLPENAVQPGTRAAWRRWLQRHHTRERGVWFVSYKPSSGKARMTYEDMIEEALRVGWIDGLARPLDGERSMLWLSPRKPRSIWSPSNKQRVARLVASGLMLPAGHAVIDRAKANGSWTAFDAVHRLEVPDDLARALRRVRGATATFQRWSTTVKKGFLGWVHQAKRAETRERRISEVVARARAADPHHAAGHTPTVSGSSRG